MIDLLKCMFYLLSSGIFLSYCVAVASSDGNMMCYYVAQHAFLVAVNWLSISFRTVCVFKYEMAFCALEKDLSAQHLDSHLSCYEGKVSVLFSVSN